MSKTIFEGVHYKRAKIYVAHDDSGKPSTETNWYVYFYVIDPRTGKLVMRKKAGGINRIKNARSRLYEARNIQKGINRLLEEGYNPLDDGTDRRDTLKSCIDLYLETHVSKLKRLTYHSVKGALGLLLLHFEKNMHRTSVAINRISKTDIQDALNFCYKYKGWSNRQYNNQLARWRTFFNWLIDHAEKIDHNPCDRIQFLKFYPTDRNRPPTEDEFKRIVNHLYKTDKQLFLYAMIIYYEGFRVTETGMLHRSQIEFNTTDPYFRLPAKGQKDNEDIIHYVSPHLLEYFYEMGIDKVPVDHFIFSDKMLPGPRQIVKMKDNVEERWRKAVKNHKTGLGINVDLYSMKHKQATELGEIVSDKDISTFLRHSSEEVTRMYMKNKRAIVKIEFFKNQRPLPIERD